MRSIRSTISTRSALAARPDLQAALETIQQSETNHKLADGERFNRSRLSGAWYTWNSSTNNPTRLQTLGASVNIPLRIFDQEPGRKQAHSDRHRSQPAGQRSHAGAGFQRRGHGLAKLVRSNIELLKPYKAKYNDRGAARCATP